MHRWYQIDLKEALKFENEGLILPGKGYKYRNEAGLDMVEIHIDEIPDNALLPELMQNAALVDN